MYSILPALVSLLFLGCGIYVLASRGANRVTLSFYLMCAATFLWQFSWTLLFQVRDPAIALSIVKFGYLIILFLPTTLYQFIAELTKAQAERPCVAASYGLALLLAVALLCSDAVVDGMRHYFFGFYPKAGWLHPLHMLQTAAVVLRAMHLLYRRQRIAVSTERARLRYCLFSLLIYFCASVDYLCNYGLAFYPPGVLFISVSLGLIARATVRHDLLTSPIVVAATIAHEMRTPLLTIRAQARALARGLPELIAVYQHSHQDRPQAAALRPEQLSYLLELGQHIDDEVSRSNFIVDMMLASARIDTLDKQEFAIHSMKKCVADALARYPFEPGVRGKVTIEVQDDFTFYGSDILLIYVIHNLLKNSLHAIQAAGKGEIKIAFYAHKKYNHLMFTDTGDGIPEHVLPHVFDPFYTTRQACGGTGMGLAFCQRVLTAFDGEIRCESVEGNYTRFLLEFPPTAPILANSSELAGGAANSWSPTGHSRSNCSSSANSFWSTSLLPASMLTGSGPSISITRRPKSCAKAARVPTFSSIGV
jgi:signal transduction histidine kinase